MVHFFEAPTIVIQTCSCILSRRLKISSNYLFGWSTSSEQPARPMQAKFVGRPRGNDVGLYRRDQCTNRADRLRQKSKISKTLHLTKLYGHSGQAFYRLEPRPPVGPMCIKVIWHTNRKPYLTYRMVPCLVTLTDL